MLQRTRFFALLVLAIPVVPGTASAALPRAAFGSEIAFEANAGQHDPRVRFAARERRDTLLVTPDRGILLLPGAAPGAARVALRFGLAGARADADCRGEHEFRGRASYFLGKDPARWRTGVARFARVVCSDVRPGVDVVYYGRDGRLEVDLVLAPGVDASDLVVRFEGADEIAVAGDGSLALRGAFGALSQRAPRAYQRDGSGERPVAARWIATPGGARLALGAHDAQLALVVDPVIDYATPLGGTGSETAFAIGFDAAGNVHVGGETTSLDFPGASGVLGGSRDAFWAVLSPDGSSLLHATYYGGSGGESVFVSVPGAVYAANSAGLAVAPDGGAVLVGTTTSTDLPTTPSAPQTTYEGGTDVFAVRFAAGGAQLVWSTYLGGTKDDVGSAVVLDAFGNAYVTGTTSSLDFPVKNPFQGFCNGPGFEDCVDAFLTKIPPAGTGLTYSTYLGGQKVDRAFGVATDAAGAAYVVGATESSSFPLQNPLDSQLEDGGLCSQFGPCSDAFVTKFFPNGQALVYSTFLGGWAADVARAVAVHPAGALLVAGYTAGGSFPRVNAAQPVYGGGDYDGFVAFLDGTGSRLRYSTFLGTNQSDVLFGAALDAQGVATVVGTSGAPSGFDGSHDALVAQLGPNGVLGSMQTLGGSGGEHGYGAALDAGANPWLVGATGSADFPSVDPLQSVQARDAFVVKLAPAPGDLACNVDFSQPSYGNGETVQVTSLRFQNTTPLPKRVLLRLTLAPPGEPAFAAADVTTWFGPGFQADLAPVNLIAVTPSSPRGTIELGCELLDAADGTIRASDLGSVEIQ